MLLKKLKLFVFPLVFIFLTTIIFFDNIHLLSKKNDSIINTYIQGAKEGNYGYGNPTNANNNINFEKLILGDILLGGWENCAYGRFSHAGLYIGNNMVLESYIDYGVTLNPVQHYTNYPEIAILRVNADKKVRQNAVDYALKKENRMFFPLSFKNSQRYFNCTHIIWLAYNKQGVNLDENNDILVAPDDYYYSTLTKVLEDKGQL
ncbi:hypothetical protein SYNTR_0255 [Candidatus Syntrophocurvum alkaliphilum]|uniref:Uncharacterized protein n=1 Tax=Candidatus Syntrophocurvum alkaliphilum TaxID=2293317 RepID=A0A6I6DE28_9FIRM|nr:YiiX/YebB-like N1pC/P60 family cysteine hydrolase [Candidatus Syntrophocurvum alkaliphilum]QGT98848.1 hypothetical protein SYNTR_0255 [Candidatus Syntrophocurvum alkaliphilum]